jgi:hypothetical protein
MVYTTPEQLQLELKLCGYVEGKQVARVVVDAAHVIRDWEESRRGQQVLVCEWMHDGSRKEKIEWNLA